MTQKKNCFTLFIYNSVLSEPVLFLDSDEYPEPTVFFSAAMTSSLAVGGVRTVYVACFSIKDNMSPLVRVPDVYSTGECFCAAG